MARIQNEQDKSKYTDQPVYVHSDVVKFISPSPAGAAIVFIGGDVVQTKEEYESVKAKFEG